MLTIKPTPIMMPFCAGTQARTRLFCSNGQAQLPTAIP